MAGDAYLCTDAFIEFLAVRDDAYTAVGLTGYVLQLFEGGHDAVQALFVESAETFVNEKDIDVEVGPVERREGQ